MEGEKKKQKVGCIYALMNPDDETVFYVGATTNRKARMGGHITNIKKSKSPMYQFIRDGGFRPVMKILADNVPLEKMKETENFWIKKYLESGTILKNSVCNSSHEGKSIRKEPPKKLTPSSVQPTPMFP